jgi:hypothetical protein
MGLAFSWLKHGIYKSALDGTVAPPENNCTLKLHFRQNETESENRTELRKETGASPKVRPLI